MVVFFHRNVRFLPKLLPRCLLDPPLLLRRRPYHPTTHPTTLRAHNPHRDLRHLQALPLNLRYFALSRPAPVVPPRLSPNEVLIPCRLDCALRDVFRTGVLLPVDICREWECEFLLRYYAGLVVGPEYHGCGCVVCGVEG